MSKMPNKNLSFHDVFIDGEWFKDESGRVLIFRGTNLTAKTPSAIKKFYDHTQVSFIGKPFPLEDAQEHFTRLRYFGFTLLRLGVTWEAIEHDGPCLYDEAYLSYITKFVEKAGEHGLHVFIDFHQDVWSRFTGGDGAPGWTLEKAGFEISHLEETGGAILHDMMREGHHLLWPTNAYKLGAATMFTLFFGGNRFLPNHKIDERSSQDYLQEHYINMIKVLAHRLKNFKNVIGYDVMNEPLKGYIGCKNLNKVFGLLQFGDTPTPIESMLLGDGYSLDIDIWGRGFFSLKKISSRKINEGKKRAWQEGRICPFRKEGVWDVNDKGVPILLKPGYFSEADFENDFYKPFLLKVKKAIHDIDEDSMVFIENVVGARPPKLEGDETKNVVFTGHWYDAFVLVTKTFWSCIGFDLFRMKGVFALPRWIRKSFANQISHFKHFAHEKMGSVPTLISEFGVPLDLDNKKAYQTGDFWEQNKALNRSFVALEDNLISATIWNYTPTNSNLLGDLWNDEDLSIFSPDQHFDETHPYSGVRAKEALIRPYAMKTSGTPLYMHFDMEKGVFEFMFRHDESVSAPTEIFLPHLHFGEGVFAELSDGYYSLDEKRQYFTYFHTLDVDTHFIRLTRKELERQADPTGLIQPVQ